MATDTLLRVDELVLHFKTQKGSVRAVDGVRFDLAHKGTFILGDSPDNLTILEEFLPLLTKLNIMPSRPLRNAIDIKSLGN